jgi:hypothetical protein
MASRRPALRTRSIPPRHSSSRKTARATSEGHSVAGGGRRASIRRSTDSTSRSRPEGPPLHFFEQYRTSCQQSAHFRRQAKGRPQVEQIFSGGGGDMRGRTPTRDGRSGAVWGISARDAMVPV